MPSVRGEALVMGPPEIIVYEAVAIMHIEEREPTTEALREVTGMDDDELDAALRRLQELDMLRGLGLGPRDWDARP